MKKVLTVFFIISAIFIAGGCSSYQYDDDYFSHTTASSAEQTQETATETINDIFYDFETTDLYGNEITNEFFADYDLTMVVVWTTWCSFCKQEIPDLQSLATEYADKSFAILSILQDAANRKSYEPDKATVEKGIKIMESNEATYPVIIPDKNLMTGILAAITAYPTTFFVDKEGNIIEQSFVKGAMNKDGWKEVIDDFLTQVNDNGK